MISRKSFGKETFATIGILRVYFYSFETKVGLVTIIEESGDCFHSSKHLKYFHIGKYTVLSASGIFFEHFSLNTKFNFFDCERIVFHEFIT